MLVVSRSRNELGLLLRVEEELELGLELELELELEMEMWCCFSARVVACVLGGGCTRFCVDVSIAIVISNYHP